MFKFREIHENSVRASMGKSAYFHIFRDMFLVYQFVFIPTSITQIRIVHNIFFVESITANQYEHLLFYLKLKKIFGKKSTHMAVYNV